MSRNAFGDWSWPPENKGEDTMLLMLIRHGDPDYANDALTELGRRQALALAERLAGVRIDEMYCSPLGRAALTCAPVAERKGMTPETLPWLRELNGNYAGNQWAWNHHGCDAFAHKTEIGSATWGGMVPYGEHIRPVAAGFHDSFDRFLSGKGLSREDNLYRLGADFTEDKTMAFFCHAGVILTLLSHLLHVPLPVCYSQFACEPSSVSRLALETKDAMGIFRLVSLNDMSHMG